MLHTALPDKKGERTLVQQLKAASDPQLHIWCGLNFIPGVRDCDLLLWHETVGVFLVEVKAVSLGYVERYGWARCKIQNRPEDNGPVHQAAEAMYSLRNFLSGRGLKPWIIPTAAWPLIRRDEWNQRWDDKRICGAYAESMLFYEDIHSTPKALIERLAHIRANPPRGEAPHGPFVNRKSDLDALVRELSVNAKPVQAPSDIERLNAIEQRVIKEERERVPPRSGQRWFYHGKPGTGKTFRLLRIGFWHAMEGCNVLYLCFNKVLGADVQRTLNFSEKLALSNGSLDARDAFDVLRRFVSSPVDAVDHDEWARTVVELVREQGEDGRKYDTILVDEAQDLPSWAFDMVFLHASKNATILVAAGRGQEMYGVESEALTAFRKKAKNHRCNRNFRNTEEISRFAMTFGDCEGDVSRIPSVVKSLGMDATNQQELIFERPGGALPALIFMDDNEIDALSEESPDYADLLDEARIKQYQRIIENEQDNLRASERPIDLLILVPSENHFERKWVCGALDSMKAPYLDYTDPNKRRCPPQSDLIRVCTFHSSRGIEGQRVLIFGMERLDELSNKIGVSPTKLGYIILSRASLDLAIAYRPRLKSTQMRFVEAAIDYLRPKAGLRARS